MSPDVFDAKTTTKKTSVSRPKRPNVPPFSTKHKSPIEYSSVLAAEKVTRSGWSAYAPLPEHVCFESQQDDETILMFLRQHPIVNVPWLIIAAIMIIAPALLIPLFMQFFPLPINYIFVLTLSWYL